MFLNSLVTQLLGGGSIKGKNCNSRPHPQTHKGTRLTWFKPHFVQSGDVAIEHTFDAHVDAVVES